MNNEPDLTVLSLGLGVQSTCLLLMTLEGETKEKPDCAIFSDTGWEPDSVYRTLEKMQKKCQEHDFPLHVVSRGNIRDDVLNHIERWRKDGGGWSRVGQPPFYVIDRKGKPDTGGTLWRQCTSEYKIEPITQKIRSLLGYTKGQRVKHHVHQWFGISLDEVQRMRDAHHGWITNVYPLINELRMDRNNCQKWLDRYGWGDTAKSACIGCPYHSDWQWREIKENDPKGWQDVVTFDKELRNGPYPKVTGQVYLHKSMVPLEDADLSTAEDRGQLSFLNECEGMCGV